MNSTVYLFGDFGQSLTSYPNDYTKEMFSIFINYSSAPTQLIIHRDGDIMNYGYIRKIENKQFFGLCLQINGQYLIGIKKLLEVFEEIIANLCIKGTIIKLDNNGNVISNIPNLTNIVDDIEKIRSVCNMEFMPLSLNCRSLPPVDYSTSADDIETFSDEDNETTILTSSVKNGYTFVYKSADFDTLSLSSYRSILANINKENEANKQQVFSLNKELEKVKKQKEQMNVVVCLIIVLFIGAIIFSQTIVSQNQEIRQQQEVIASQSATNDVLVEKNYAMIISQDSLQRLYNILNYQYNSLTETNSILTENFNKLKQEKSQLQTDYNALKRRESSTQQSLSKSQTKVSELNSENWELRTKLESLANKYYSTTEGQKELERYGWQY